MSDRVAVSNWSWIAQFKYWPPNVLTFLVPYINGDVSNGTYIGPPLSFFWEDYGYVGVAPFFLCFYAAVREWRRPAVMFVIAATIVSFLMVLGPATPFFHAAYLIVPGMNAFRFPTRFLIVVELGIALLGARGLTAVREDLERLRASRFAAHAVAAAICVITAADLFVHQPRQNPMVPADTWLAAPPVVSLIQRDTRDPRTFTPRHRDLHKRAFVRSRGWQDVHRFYDLRNILEPNTGGAFWNVPSGDCYAGISPRWYVDVWGDHNREDSLMRKVTAFDFESGVVTLAPAVPNLLRMYGVTHVLSTSPQQQAGLGLLARVDGNYIYRVAGAARVRYVPSATYVGSDQEAIDRLMSPGFDPDREVLIHDAVGEKPFSDGHAASVPAAGVAHVSVVGEDPRHVIVDAEIPADGFLLLADTFSPGWTAEVDGRAAAIYRADISVRAVEMRKGRHSVSFVYAPPGLRKGALVSSAAVLALCVWLVGCLGAFRLPRRVKPQMASADPTVDRPR